jgi:hypothetical protein
VAQGGVLLIAHDVHPGDLLERADLVREYPVAGYVREADGIATEEPLLLPPLLSGSPSIAESVHGEQVEHMGILP